MKKVRTDVKILILGGTGAMGSHLAEIAAAVGMQVHVTSRSSIKTKGSIRHIQGNAMDERFIETILETKWDAIIDFMVYLPSVLHQRLPKFLEATDQYIFLSSARVYADSPTLITENTPRLLDVCRDEVYLATDEYALAKAKQEDSLRNSGKKNWTIVRPYITYADERLQLGVLEKEAWLYRALKGRSIVFSRDIIDNVTTMTSGRDVAQGILSLIGQPTAMGEVFHITSSHSYPWRRVINIYLQVLENHLGKRPNILLLDMNQFLRCHSGEYQVKYDRMFDRRFDNTKINDYVNVGNFSKCEDELRSCLAAFIDQPKFKDINWRLEAEKDRLSGEKTPLNEIPGNRNKIKYILLRYFNIYS